MVERLTEDRIPKYSDLGGILSPETIEAIEEARGERKKVDKSEFKNIVEHFEEGKG